MLRHVFSAVMPRFSGASSIPEASLLNSTVSGILDRPIESGDDTEKVARPENDETELPERT
jgi:hypothetical protein